MEKGQGVCPVRTFDGTIDNENVYDNQINPLMKQIIEICKGYNIPMLAAFQLTGEDENGDPLLCVTALLPEGCDKSLRNARVELNGEAYIATIMTIDKTAR